MYEEETRSQAVNEDLRKRLAEDLGLPKPLNTHHAHMSPPRPRLWLPLACAGVCVMVLMVVTSLPSSDAPVFPLAFGERVDDWAYKGSMDYDDFSSNAGAGTSLSKVGLLSNISVMDTSGMASESALGLSVGGAKDVNAFRLDIENGYTPLPTDITYEGLFYEYFFDTGASAPCEELFCPSYRTAVSPDPLSGKTDQYLSVGLASGISASDFKRKPLNLVVVLDISGSMGSAFDRYYYDGTYGTEEAFNRTSKMEVAKEALKDLVGHLEDEDRFGVVLFDDAAVLAKPLRLMGETDVSALLEHVDELQPQGGTDMSAGINLGTSLFEDVSDEGYENRIILLTDAQPNTGDLSEGGMRGRMEKNAKDGLYTTFVGIGVDFQTELIDAITKTRGANYYAVHSPEEFQERMGEGFDFMVTPLVFDLELSVDAKGFEIEQVYGSPEADKATGRMMYVNTLFPSLTNEDGTKGGVVLLKLKQTGSDPNLLLHVSYTDRDGKTYENTANVTFLSGTETVYENNGIRKAVWLARYADLMKNWMIDVRKQDRGWFGDELLVSLEEGIIVPPEPSSSLLSRWEQTSVPLRVSAEYRSAFETFQRTFESEIEAIGDETMRRELDVLNKLTEEIF